MKRPDITANRLARMNCLLEQLGETWRQFPQLRLGQLIANAIPPTFRCDPFYVRDEEMLQSLEIYAEAQRPPSHISDSGK